MKFFEAQKDYSLYLVKRRRYANFICGELFTAKELDKKVPPFTQEFLIDKGILIIKEYSRQSNYWAFGARFHNNFDARGQA